ncbi:MAG: hypothetical protein HY816_00915 [Candidatus Wallbacteria bacterium]|nr:hypothetical protein [Candidatus Wallbacteria bacterium]
MLLILAATVVPARAELEVSGQKEFRFRGYEQSGSFNQFIQDNPLFLTDTGFEQSLRLDVTGTVFDNVKLELSFDDSLESREDQKLLASVDGRVWDLAAGRMPLLLDDTKYLLFNKRALGVTATGLLGKHLVTLMAARPEGRQHRQTFRGNGSQQEFLLTDASGRRNIRVVQGSDLVQLDSRRLERGRDYDVDYEEGSVILRHYLLPIEPTSLITVEFEVAGRENFSTGSLVAFRDRYYFEGLDDPGDREPDDEYVALSVVTNAEQDPSGSTGPPLDRRLTVAAVDGQLTVLDDLMLRAELAASRLQADSSIPGAGDESGLALDLDLARELGDLTFDLSHQAVGPKFQAIGRREFVRINERSDLIRDVAATRLAGEYDVSRRLSTNLKLDRSSTNLDDDPLLPALDFGAVLAAVNYDLGADKSLSVRRRAERQETTAPGGPGGDQDRDVLTAVMSAGLFGLDAQASYEDEQNDSTLADGLTTDFVTRRVSLGSGGTERVGWSAGLEDQRRAGLGSSTSGQLLVDVTPMKTLKGNFSLLRRVESGRLTPLSTDEQSVTDTGEVKLRYEPNRKLRVDVKGSAEQRNRVVRVRDPRLPPNFRPDPREPRTVITDQPVLRLLASNTIEWRPSKKLDHRLQARGNREEEKLTERMLSENLALNYRLKFAPTQKLRVLTEWENANSRSSLAPLDRDQQVRGVQLLNAFPRGLSATLSRRSVEVQDRTLAVAENELAHGLSVEKILSRILTAEAGLENKERTGRFSDDAWTARAAVRWSPEKLPLRSELSFEHASIDGVTTAGAGLDSYRDKLGVKADYRISSQTLFEVTADFTDAGPTVAGDPGYRALTTEAKVSINF